MVFKNIMHAGIASCGPFARSTHSWRTGILQVKRVAWRGCNEVTFPDASNARWIARSAVPPATPSTSPHLDDPEAGPTLVSETDIPSHGLPDEPYSYAVGLQPLLQTQYHEGFVNAATVIGMVRDITQDGGTMPSYSAVMKLAVPAYGCAKPQLVQVQMKAQLAAQALSYVRPGTVLQVTGMLTGTASRASAMRGQSLTEVAWDTIPEQMRLFLQQSLTVDLGQDLDAEGAGEAPARRRRDRSSHSDREMYLAVLELGSFQAAAQRQDKAARTVVQQVLSFVEKTPAEHIEWGRLLEMAQVAWEDDPTKPTIHELVAAVDAFTATPLAREPFNLTKEGALKLTPILRFIQSGPPTPLQLKYKALGQTTEGTDSTFRQLQLARHISAASLLDWVLEVCRGTVPVTPLPPAAPSTPEALDTTSFPGATPQSYYVGPPGSAPPATGGPLTDPQAVRQLHHAASPDEANARLPATTTSTPARPPQQPRPPAPNTPAPAPTNPYPAAPTAPPAAAAPGTGPPLAGGRWAPPRRMR